MEESVLTCKGIVTISAVRKYNFGELILYIFHLDCQPFVRDIIIIFTLNVPVNTVILQLYNYVVIISVLLSIYVSTLQG